MKNTRSLIYGRLTVTALVYSLAVVSSSIWALINSGAESCMSSVFLVTLLGATLLSEVVDVLLCRLIDNSWLYLAIDFVAIAVIFVGSGILFNWFPPHSREYPRLRGDRTRHLHPRQPVLHRQEQGRLKADKRETPLS